VIRATYEIAPPGAAHTLAVRETTGMEGGPQWARGRVVAEGDGRAVVEFPSGVWNDNLALLVSALVAGEAGETKAISRCRLVALEFPDGGFPGPALGPTAQAAPVGVGAIVKPSIGLTPVEVGEVARAAVAGGAVFLKDDEVLGDPSWCPLDERVRAVAKALEPGVVYCPNVTGPSATLVDRARRVVELGATGVMVNAFAQGLDSLLALRQAELGVPILAHRVGSGAMTRSSSFGATGAVLARLCRLCGADYWIVGAFGGSLFDTDDEVADALAALRDPCGTVLPGVAAFGGGLGPDNVAAQVERAGGTGLLMVVGSAAYRHPEGIEGGVRAAVDAVADIGRPLGSTTARTAGKSADRSRTGHPGVSDRLGVSSRSGVAAREPIPPTIEWRQGRIVMIDQRRLPGSLELLSIASVDELCAAICSLAIRGAPALGVAGAMGIALAAATGVNLEDAACQLLATRPTAVNLAWGVHRALAADDPLVEAQRLATEDVDRNRSIGAHGADLLPVSARVYTHCNAGGLACVGYGTAIGVIRAAHEQGRTPSAWVGETRPVLQGARLTAWELTRLGIPATLVADVMAGSLMAGGEVDCIVVGADRVAANGDVANKIGTYGLAVLAHHHGVPFYVAAPTSTIDFSCPDGGAIPIERRGADEVTSVSGRRIAPEGMAVENRAFDVTPAALVTALVTENGVVDPGSLTSAG
jgi:methylthioribose-1-phosphate isomerase